MSTLLSNKSQFSGDIAFPFPDEMVINTLRWFWLHARGKNPTRRVWQHARGKTTLAPNTICYKSVYSRLAAKANKKRIFNRRFSWLASRLRMTRSRALVYSRNRAFQMIEDELTTSSFQGMLFHLVIILWVVKSNGWIFFFYWLLPQVVNSRLKMELQSSES